MSQVVNRSRWDAYAEQFKIEFRRDNFEAASSTADLLISRGVSQLSLFFQYRQS